MLLLELCHFGFLVLDVLLGSGDKLVPPLQLVLLKVHVVLGFVDDLLLLGQHPSLLLQRLLQPFDAFQHFLYHVIMLRLELVFLLLYLPRSGRLLSQLDLLLGLDNFQLSAQHGCLLHQISVALFGLLQPPQVIVLLG